MHATHVAATDAVRSVLRVIAEQLYAGMSHAAAIAEVSNMCMGQQATVARLKQY
jgi:pilus assembly protein TadC